MLGVDEDFRNNIHNIKDIGAVGNNLLGHFESP